MFAQPGPEPLDALLKRRQVSQNRDLFCSDYERCLTEALEHEWTSWTCAHCLRFKAVRQWQLQAEGLHQSA